MSVADKQKYADLLLIAFERAVSVSHEVAIDVFFDRF